MAIVYSKLCIVHKHSLQRYNIKGSLFLFSIFNVLRMNLNTLRFRHNRYIKLSILNGITTSKGVVQLIMIRAIGIFFILK